MWSKTFFFAAIIFMLSLGYISLYRGALDWKVGSETLALTGGILIGVSFALSGMTFFYNFLDSKLKYRKYLGLLGYYFAVTYTVTLIWRFPDKYWSGLPQHLLDLEVLLGLAAMSILSFMAIISMNWAAKKLGAHWRPLLRLGYVAYALLIIRAFLVEGAGWQLWAEQLDRVPPPRLLLTAFALFVILLRIVLEIALRTKKSSPAVSSPTVAGIIQSFKTSNSTNSSQVNIPNETIVLSKDSNG